MTDQFGGTPLPSPPVVVSQDDDSPPPPLLQVWYDPSVVPGQPQQPHAQQIASFEAVSNDNCPNGTLLDVNQHFCVYAVKNGLIRVLHRTNSSVRTLLRGHTATTITDISFFQNGDVLGTVGGNVLIWRIFYDASHNTIVAEKLLEIPNNIPNMTRLIWHPFNANQFWLLHNNHENVTSAVTVATLVETTRIKTVPSSKQTDNNDKDNTTTEEETSSRQHAICQVQSNNIIMDGAVRIERHGSNMTDLAWSGKDPKHVLTSHADGSICLWNIKEQQDDDDDDIDDVDGGNDKDHGLLRAKCMVSLQQDEAVTRCMFLPHDDIVRTSSTDNNAEEGITSAFLTASRGNSLVTLWSAFYASSGSNSTTQPPHRRRPTKLQTFGIERPSSTVTSYNLSLCFGQAPPDGSPPAFFLLLSDRSRGHIYALHLETTWNTTATITGGGTTTTATATVPKRALAVGFNYVVPFAIKYPIYSWSIACVPAEALSEDEEDDDDDVFMDVEPTTSSRGVSGLNFDMRLQVYQSKMVQQYTLPHYMVLPPSTTWNDQTIGVRVETITAASSLEEPTMAAAMGTYDEEDYDLDEFDGDGHEKEDLQAPEASSLPVPDGLDGAMTAAKVDAAPAVVSGANPFANWLGAIAAKTTGAPGSVPPPPTPASSSSTVPPTVSSELDKAVPLPSMEPSAFLNPAELLSAGNMTSSSSSDNKPKQPSSESKKKRHEKSVKANGGGSKKQAAAAAASPAPAKIAILKRGDEAPPVEPATAVSSSTAVSSNVEEMLKKTIAAHFKRQETFITDQVQKAVKSEMQTTVVPALSKMMTQTMEQAVVKPIKKELDKNAKDRSKVQTDVIVDAVSGSVEEPLKNAFNESMLTALLPAYEAATREMFLQIATSLEKGLAPNQSMDSSMVGALSAKMDAMSLRMESLSSEMAQLRSAVDSSQSGGPAALAPVDSSTATPQPDPLKIARQNILDLLQRREYEAAFTQALSASTADMAVFCCKNANVADVLGGSPAALSQPILLCLMQQLGAVLVSSTDDDLQTILLWLQEIALTLDPTDESIHRHVPGVLQQLVASINSKMSQGDPTLRRPLQMLLQVIRGMQR